MNRFDPRPALLREVHHWEGWRLKLYQITHGDLTLTPADHLALWPLVAGALPSPALADGRPGLGFLVHHRGRTMDYAVLCWWARDNELPLRLWIHDRAPGATWRVARGDESFCAYDLAVLWHERNAFVDTMLRPAAPDAEAYLARAFTGVID